jgi:hypothetical protein
MRPPWTVALAALALAALPLPALAQSAGFAATVGGSDSGVQQPLQGLNTYLGYVDADGDARPEGGEPEEPVYLDLDGNRQVSYGDLRLTAVAGYPAGTSVVVGNQDFALALAVAPGWFARSGPNWFVDVDGDRAVSAGDLRLGASPSRVKSSDGDVRSGLEAVQTQMSQSLRVGYLDLDNDGSRDPSEAVYLDLDPSGSPGIGKATAGDLRLTPTGPGLDDGPTRAEFEAAGRASDDGSGDAGGDGVTLVGGDRDGGGSAWGTPETVLLILGLANLAGLSVLYRRSARPRNPFK